MKFYLYIIPTNQNEVTYINDVCSLTNTQIFKQYCSEVDAECEVYTILSTNEGISLLENLLLSFNYIISKKLMWPEEAYNLIQNQITNGGQIYFT